MEVPFYKHPYNSYCMLLEKVPDYLMVISPKINPAILNMVSKFCTMREMKKTLNQMLFDGELIKIKTDELQKKNALDLLKEYFKSLGFDKKGVLVGDLMSHALYTNTKEEHH